MTKLEDILLPPHDMELEKLWLNMCFMFKDSIDKIDKNCFYVDDYKKLYESFNKTRSDDVSVLAVDSWLEQWYIFDILSDLVSESSVEYICKELIKYKNARTIIRWIQRLEWETRWLDIDKAKTTLEKITEMIDEFDEDETLEKQTKDYFMDIDKEQKKIVCWFDSIDEYCKFAWWQLVIIAGRPWMWKTTVMLNKALRESTKYNVWFTSMEMKVGDIIDRIVCILSWLTSYQLEKKSDHIAKIMEYLEKLLEKKLFLSDKIYTINKIEQFVVKNKLDVCYVDYLGLINHWSSNMRTIDKISEITRQLKLIALKHNVEIVLWSQLSRDVEKRPDKRPILSDLRDSGSIEQDADMVLMLYREDYYDKETERKWILDILVRKNRNWMEADIPLWLKLSSFRMFDKSF